MDVLYLSEFLPRVSMKLKRIWQNLYEFTKFNSIRCHLIELFHKFYCFSASIELNILVSTPSD